jgi:hypothetical protein
MRARPRVKKYKQTRFSRCPKCHKNIRMHQKRCKVCHQLLKK